MSLGSLLALRRLLPRLFCTIPLRNAISAFRRCGGRQFQSLVGVSWSVEGGGGLMEVIAAEIRIARFDSAWGLASLFDPSTQPQ